MIRRTFFTAALAVSLALPVAAEPLVDAGALAWSMTLRPQAMAASRLGQSWSREVGSLHEDWTEKYDLMSESLGVDLFESSDTFIMFNEDYEVGAFNAVVSLGGTAGNIEGAMLSVPGYESRMIDDETILNAIPWEHRGREGDYLYSAVVRLDEGQSNYFVAGLSDAKVEELVRRLQSGFTNLELFEDDTSALMVVHAYRPAPKRQLRGRHAGLLGLLTGMDLRVVEDETVTVTLAAEMENAVRARQVHEMMQGWTTFLTLAAGFNDAAGPTHEVMQQIEIIRDDRRVTLSMDCEPEAMMAAIRNLAVDKPFDGHEHRGHHPESESHDMLDLDSTDADN